MSIRSEIKVILTVWLWGLLPGSLQASEITRFTANQGLPGTDITAICENENYIWIATNDGLCRFDGKVFKVFKKESNAVNCISENNIETLFFDSRGLLWIGFKTGGADIYDPKSGIFTHISQFTDRYPQRVIAVFEDSRNKIWLGSWEEGLYELIPSKVGELKYQAKVHFNEFIVSSIIEQPKDQIWVGTYAGLYLYRQQQDNWITCDSRLIVSQLTKENCLDGGVLCSTWNEGVLQIEQNPDDPFSPLITPLCAKDNQVYRVFSMNDTLIYVGTWGNGLKIFDHKNNRLASFDPQFRPSVILCFLKDSYNSFWVGTYGNGLFQITTTDRGLRAFSPISTSGYAAAYTLKALDDNLLILGTEGEGLYHCDLLRSSLEKRAGGILKNNQNNFILTIYKDKELVVIGHDDEGVYLAPLLKSNLSGLSYKACRGDKRFAKVTSIFKSGDGKFWFGTKQNGLISADYNPRLARFENYSFFNLSGIGQITGLAQYDDQRLWIASHSGLYLFNTSINNLDGTRQLKISEMIYSMVRDVKNECLWLGTSVGLCRINYRANEKPEIPFSGILPQGAIYNLILDSSDNLWFSVGGRVFCLTDRDKRIKEINLGEFGNQFFFSSTTNRINGKDCVVFGGEKSLVIVDPSVVLNQPDASKIIFTELQIDHNKVNVGDKIYGQTILKQQTEYIDKIEFSYRCKWVSLSFTQVGWNNFKNHYQYKIEGFSQNWQLLDVDKPIIFSQLQPDNYKLIIKRFDASETEAPLLTLGIIVIPPWWRTGWFYILLIVAILVSVVGLLFFIINYYKKREIVRLAEIEKKKKEEILLEKESFFAGLSHDLLTSFTLIIAPVGDLLKAKELVPENMEKVQIIYKNAVYLSDVFKTILDFRRVESIDFPVERRKTELVSFVRVIVDSFGYLARSKHIDFRFETSTTSLYVLIDVVKLERILFNLLSNAFKFTPEDGKIKFTLEYMIDEEKVAFRVEDTGVGIEADKLELIFEKFYQNHSEGNPQGFGLGLYIVRKFIELLQGTICITSERNNGTCVSIELPIQKSEQEIQNCDVPVDPDQVVTILLVEDNEEMKNYLKGHLSRYFSVATASDGSEAFDFIQNNLPEMVISDVIMPGIDGLTLCDKIKSNPLYSDIFVVLLSAKSSPEDELRGYKAGADFYIGKPFDCECFIKQLLNIYSTRIQRRKQILKSIFSQKDGTKYSTPKDDFLNKAIQVIEKHIMDENFKRDDFAYEMNISKTVLHRKFKLLIGETPNAFVRHVRLHKATELLINSNLTVAEIAYLTGFNQSHYFIKCFREVYNETPKTYRGKKGK
ncbi:MAG: ATP-binding protein [Bacteroidales bacterium]|jgi:signal transduction histidine kinase/ligand-binding sensor domain-containing protein/DNA-binding response OmpR family regulator|nr:ATP-binding protein [Bacteroidales bacterium]